jgi:hypothetical protein
MITVVYVHFFKAASQTDNVTKRACLTILLMNTVYIISLLCAVVPVLSLLEVLEESDLLFSLTVIFYGVSFYFMPVLSSAWNPIVLFAKVRAVRKTCLSLMSSLLPGMQTVRNRSTSAFSIGDYEPEQLSGQQSGQGTVRKNRANSGLVETAF